MSCKLFGMLWCILLLPNVTVWHFSNATTTDSTTSTDAATTTTTTTVTTMTTTAEVSSAVAPVTSSLSCYDCSESFKYIWEPYTQCQTYPETAPLRPCLGIETYCKVERVSYKSSTVSIIRSCTQECWHGCYASGFGLTRLTCTSCCRTPGCNTGSGGEGLGGYLSLVLLGITCPVSAVMYML